VSWFGQTFPVCCSSDNEILCREGTELLVVFSYATLSFAHLLAFLLLLVGVLI
jgi:hypothetical protein